WEDVRDHRVVQARLGIDRALSGARGAEPDAPRSGRALDDDPVHSLGAVLSALGGCRPSTCSGAVTMINGVHTLIYTPDADRLRAFFRDVLGFPSVDAGHGWLIFGLPPGELAAHPAGEHENPAAGASDTRFEMYLMCD